MKINWYYRMMLSYTPIFFVVVSSLIFIFFMVLNHASEKKYIETNEAILERMVYNTDASLMLIERNIVSKLLTDERLQLFYTSHAKTAYDDYEIQKQLVEMKSSFPFPNAIYLYQEADKRIISESGAYPLDAFGDKDFLDAFYPQEELGRWTAPRSFAYLPFDENRQQVVTLLKHYDDGERKLGAIVINVYASAISDYMNSFNDTNASAVQWVDRLTTEPAEDSSLHAESTIVVRSDYTGWQFAADSVYDAEYSILSFIFSAWSIVAILIIILALAGFTLVTHIHYKPIQSILAKAGRFSARKSEELGVKQVVNEFDFIETALDQLLQKAVDYEHLHKEDSALKQQRLCHDLLAGHIVMDDAQFARELHELGLPCRYDRLAVLAVEIDHYSDFLRRYPPGDRHLLKFIVESAFRDLCQQHQLFVWHAWMEPDRVAFVVHRLADTVTAPMDLQTGLTASGTQASPAHPMAPAAAPGTQASLAHPTARMAPVSQAGLAPPAAAIHAAMAAPAVASPQTAQTATTVPTISTLAEELREWIETHLQLTVTIGIGADSDGIDTIADSYRNAVDNVSLKSVFGFNTLIDNRRSAAAASLDSYAYLQAIESAAQSFRMHESDWREKLAAMFRQLHSVRFARQEMAALVGSFVLQMAREINALSPSIQRIWREEYQARFAELHETADTLSELEEALMSAMYALEAAVDQDRQARRHHSIALQAKSYIDAHFADAELSLSLLSAYLNVQPNTLSLLFKEELGEKFIDYVLKVRMDKAKQLLVETDQSVQAVAEQVGYLNVISFYRTFKKHQGVPPGEYRTLQIHQGSS
ncbi:hypothetical protein PA598K_00555 [Paenibacillus sp. 598K]|uniref:AraC family transcriptional regulator n=1 Tax=Paenibacillus sp. 598K TaxID=1117987 RepID=UPI000FF9D611|nr:AraC family transcriptional regulator [Paenibacillus sp. 598K]GBF72315.1 hypothetical protein PA598K_00555 [Paenibacillus sp. 598K]